MSEADRRALLSLGTVRRHGPSEALIHEGGSNRDVFIILEGCVKVLTHTPDGRTRLLAIRSVGELLGELAALDGAPRAASVVTATATVVQVVHWAAFERYLRLHPAAETAVRSSIATKLRQATTLRTYLGGGPVVLRVAKILCHLAVSHGQTTPGGVAINLPLRQLELAALVGAAAPTVQKALGDLRRQDLVITRYRGIVIRDLDGLAEVADGDAAS